MWNKVALLLLACGLVGGCLYLVEKDAATGSGYPEYSSFRADPQGAKVLYESLGRTAGLTVSRNYRELTQWKGAGATLVVLGIPEYSLLHEQKAEFEQWERRAKSNRVVLAAKPSSGEIDFTEARRKSVMASRWGLELGKTSGKSPEWRRVFEKSEGWTALLNYRGKPVLVERMFGAGSVVVASDSRFFANEALADQPDAAILAQVVGANARVEFDESHFGITETGGVMALARKYRLQGLIAGLALLAALFFWKTGVRFPVHAEEIASGAALGRDAQAGFAGLLQRHITSSQVIEECLRQWRKTAPRDSRFEQMQVAANVERDPLRAYGRIRKELERKGQR